MEDEPVPSPRTDLVGHLFARALTAFGVFGILAALLTFFSLLPATLSATSEISSLNPYSYFLLNVTSSAAAIYAVLAISAAIVTISVVALFVGKNDVSVGLRKTNRISFYRYFSVFILIELVLSVISPLISPSYANNPVLQMSLPSQNFVFLVSTVSQTVIVQLIPIMVLAVIFLAYRRKLSLKALMNPDRSLKGVELPIVAISAGAAAILTSVGIGSGLLNFVSFFVLNYIFVRFGFFRSVIAGFTVSQFNIILQLGQLPIFPLIMYGFLVIWSIVGIYSFITLFTQATQNRNRSNGEPRRAVPTQGEEEGEVQPQRIMTRVEREMLNPANFWIRSACPACGNFNFHLKEDMALECKNCHQQIDKDAVGEFNIRLIRSRGFQN